ncbi:MAG: hypothetical protein U0Z44_11875 [Kouleothrix sp.]
MPGGSSRRCFAKGATLAGRFEGDLEVTGDIRLLNADCAEDFDVLSGEQAEPGTVMVVGEAGSLVPSQQAYDRRVAGVISGAGDYKPGIVLDSHRTTNPRRPIALLAKYSAKSTPATVRSRSATCSPHPTRRATP